MKNKISYFEQSNNLYLLYQKKYQKRINKLAKDKIANAKNTKEIIREMTTDGFNQCQIGGVMGKHPSTIFFHINGKK